MACSAKGGRGDMGDMQDARGRGGPEGVGPHDLVDDVPIAILTRRFAAGEITRAAYERMRRVLFGDNA